VNETGASLAFVVLRFSWEAWWFHRSASRCWLRRGSGMDDGTHRPKRRGTGQHKHTNGRGSKNNLAAIVESDDAILGKTWTE
jgi:hypothetical protein